VGSFVIEALVWILVVCCHLMIMALILVSDLSTSLRPSCDASAKTINDPVVLLAGVSN
jgi:hypothetical protein